MENIDHPPKLANQILSFFIDFFITNASFDLLKSCQVELYFVDKLML